MRRKRHPVKVNHERWLISYADFITLLFAFFVVLFATGQSDRHKKAELAASIQSAFAEMGIFDTHTDPRPLVETKIMQQLLQATAPENQSGAISIRESDTGLVISLAEAGFFESGTAAIRPSSLPVLNRIAELLPETSVQVEGYTDDVPIHTAQFASNWELSSARASSIAQLLLTHANVRADRMSVAGYAEFHPMVSNATASGRERNRRVDIVLLTNQP